MDYIDKLIKERANWIREQIKGGMLYGKRIDFDNEDMVLVATWCWGEHEGLETLTIKD
jgi:hypothetical protein